MCGSPSAGRPAARPTSTGTFPGAAFLDLDDRAVRAARPGRTAPAARPGRPAGGAAPGRRTARAPRGRLRRRRRSGRGPAVVDAALGRARRGERARRRVRGLDRDRTGRSSRVRPSRDPGDITVRPGGCRVLDAAAAAELARTGVLLDARIGAALPRRDRADRPGRRAHPGRGQPAGRRSSTGPDGRLRPADELRERLRRPGCGPAPVGAYCGSGLTAAKTVLALHRGRVRRRRRCTWVRGATGSPTRPGRSATGEGT